MGGKSNLKNEQRSLRKNFYIFVLGVLLTFSSYLSIIVLQSSINIDDGLGIMSLGIVYASSVIFVLFFTPTLMRRIGYKFVLLLGEATYILYMLANFYPKLYTMFPAAVAVGLGEAMIWSTLPIYYVHFGHVNAKMGSKPISAYVQKYTGRFVATIQTSQVAGNLISYAILYGRKSENDIHAGVANFTEQSRTVNRSIGIEQDPDRFASCGANDCQNPNVTSKDRAQYHPSDQYSRHILMGVMTTLCVIGCILHVVFLSNFYPEEWKTEKQEGNNAETDSTGNRERSLDGQCLPYKTIKDTFVHLKSKLQLLLMPLTLYYGFHISFLMGELTRAFASCIVGVEQVGITVALFATSAGIVALLSEKVLQKISRNALIAVGFAFDLFIHLFCLFWRPNIATTWIVYLIFCGFGATDGIWKTTIIVTYEEYFPKNREIAFSVWNMWITLGIAIQYLFSTMLCVGVKISIQIAVFVLGIFGYILAEYSRRKKRPSKFKESKEESSSETLI